MLRSRRRGIGRNLGARVLVHTRDDRTIDGVLVGNWTDVIALAHATILQPGDAPDVPLGGETIIPRENVSLIQAAP